MKQVCPEVTRNLRQTQDMGQARAGYNFQRTLRKSLSALDSSVFKVLQNDHSLNFLEKQVAQIFLISTSSPCEFFAGRVCTFASAGLGSAGLSSLYVFNKHLLNEYPRDHNYPIRYVLIYQPHCLLLQITFLFSSWKLSPATHCHSVSRVVLLWLLCPQSVLL